MPLLLISTNSSFIIFSLNSSTSDSIILEYNTFTSTILLCNICFFNVFLTVSTSAISGSKELQDAFINGQDIHKKVAADIFGVEEKDVSKEMRSTAKAVIFGIVYGISGFGLGENLSINAKEAKTFIDKYLELYPGVKKYMDNIVKEAYEKGYVKTLFDRKRNIDELKSKVYQVRSAGERIALNTPIQGTSADIIKMAMVKIDREFTKLNIKSKMILQVHDELIFDIKLAEKEQVESIVKDIMENIVSLSVP